MNAHAYRIHTKGNCCVNVVRVLKVCSMNSTDSAVSSPSTPRWNVDRPYLTGRFHQVFHNSIFNHPFYLDLSFMVRFMSGIAIDEIVCRKPSMHLALLNQRAFPWIYSGIIEFLFIVLSNSHF